MRVYFLFLLKLNELKKINSCFFSFWHSLESFSLKKITSVEKKIKEGKEMIVTEQLQKQECIILFCFSKYTQECIQSAVDHEDTGKLEK
jgi:hypothetical protein